ncbi:UNVERIFIED_ORG: methyl-accepting chemotaxis protein [Roseateles sp. XES5]|nr:globin-coupled sensor protein [Roseateles sp. XES5]
MSAQDAKTQQLNERLQFVDLDNGQRDALKRALPTISASLDGALDIFYAKARKTPETARFFASETHIQSAKGRQVKHWELIGSATFDTQYVDAVTTIGRTHARLGLEPRWYIGGYALILEAIVDSVIKKHLEGFLYRKKADALGEEITAIVKAALVDMDYAISVYLDALQEERQKAETERQALNAEQEEALGALDTSLNRLAGGDLTAAITKPLAPQFERLRSNFNAAIERLDDTLGAIVTAADDAAGNSGELVHATDDMAKRTEQQAASLEETAAAVEEITTISREAASRAEEARRVVGSATEEAKRSGDVVEQAVSAMSEIQQSSSKISDIIGVIDGIAFQTNILALNAAVEAARAGEQGRGFAVVAGEVRTLAQRSAEAAKEIKSLIDDSVERVQSGVSLVNRTGEALHHIGEQVVHINAHIDAIASSAREQSAGISEINTAVGSMDQMTQQNAAMVEETNAATHNLMQISTTLKGLVDRFTVSAVRSEQPAKPAHRRYG